MIAGFAQRCEMLIPAEAPNADLSSYVVECDFVESDGAFDHARWYSSVTLSECWYRITLMIQSCGNDQRWPRPGLRLLRSVRSRVRRAVQDSDVGVRR